MLSFHYMYQFFRIRRTLIVAKRRFFVKEETMKLIALLLTTIIGSWIPASAFPDADCVGSLKTLRAVLALDCSGSVDDYEWAITITFAKSFIEMLFDEAPETKVAIEFFSDRDTLILDFTDDRDEVLAALDTRRCSGGTLFPEKLQSLFDSLEPDTTKMLLLCTDGHVNNIELAGPLKDSGVTIFTAGIGSDVSVDSLESICSQPPAVFNQVIPSYQELPIAVETLIHKLTAVAVRYAKCNRQ